MTTTPWSVESLKRQRPEWTPWLAVVDEALRESASARWDEVAVTRQCPTPNARRPKGSLEVGSWKSGVETPLLDGAEVLVDAEHVRAFFGRLVQIATRSGAPAMATVGDALEADMDPAELMRASLRGDVSNVAVGPVARADSGVVQAIASLLAIPLLQAVHRQWAADVPEGWNAGYCPLCGAWPAFAEVRGVERTRQLRCGRCGCGWHGPMLRCAYCDNKNHDELVTLVPERTGSSIVDACRRCRGYVKAFTTLQGCRADAVMLRDLASVELDIAAIDQGFERPQGGGYPPEVSVRCLSSARRNFAWNA